MIFLVIFLMCLFVTLVIGGAAALSDIRSMTIPNVYSLYVFAAFTVAYCAVFFSGNEAMFSHVVSHLISAVITFVVTLLLFLCRVIGAGDSKFATACAFWIGAKFLPIYLFYMTVFGGVLGAVALYIKRRKPFNSPRKGGWIDQVQSGKDKVPYGVAISFGMLIAFIYAGYFSPESLSSFVVSGGVESGS